MMSRCVVWVRETVTMTMIVRDLWSVATTTATGMVASGTLKMIAALTDVPPVVHVKVG